MVAKFSPNNLKMKEVRPPILIGESSRPGKQVSVMKCDKGLLI